MKRRRFLAVLGGTASAYPLAVSAQPVGRRMNRVGFLGLVSATKQATRVAAFRRGLSERGYIEGKNLSIDFRWAEGKYDRLPELAAELVHLKVDVIVTHTTQGVRAAKGVTTTIPIVIATVADAVAAGLVDSLAHPGGNVTGLSFFDRELMAKRLELLQEIAPSDREAAVLFNPDNPANELILQTMETTAKALRVGLQSFEVREPSQFEEIFSAIANRTIHLVVVQDDPLFINNAKAIADVLLQRRLAACGFGELAKAGGLLAYGVDFDAMYHRAAAFVDKLLKGAAPNDLPVEQPAKFELVANLKTAKALGLTIPPAMLARADELIE